MTDTIIYEKYGLIARLKTSKIICDEVESDRTTIYTRIEPGAFRSTSYIGIPNDTDTLGHLEILLEAVKRHYEEKGKIRTWSQSDGNGGWNDIQKIYELRDGKWNWYNV